MSCGHYREHSLSLLRFKAFSPLDKVLFKQKIGLHLMWIEGLSTVHIVNTNDSYQNTAVLRGKNFSEIRLAFIESWASVQTRYPSGILWNRESRFASKAYQYIATVHDNSLHFSGSQSHNLVGSEASYHGPSQTDFRIMRLRYENYKPKIILCYAVNGP